MFNKLPRNKFFLAPLAGINDPAFRLMCEDAGAGLTMTELTSIDYLYSEQERALETIERAKDERCVGLQLFGKNPEKIKNAMHIVEDKFEFFDLNAGCPANNIIGQGAGCELMQKPTVLLKMLSEIIKNTNKPVTLKYRLGINTHKENFLEIGKQAEDIGVSMITLHARYASQGYSGKANWTKIKDLKEKLNTPITGNGDIWQAEDGRKMLDETKCDYTMIGRFAMGNPRAFTQLNDYYNKGEYTPTTDKDKLQDFLKYYEETKKYNIHFERIKIQAMQFTKGIRGGVKLRTEIAKAKNEEQIIKSVKAFTIK
ncbi:MAG: tRNA dihydrouridine synthase [Candidatus Woesearchaeota archaeon]